MGSSGAGFTPLENGFFGNLLNRLRFFKPDGNFLTGFTLLFTLLVISIALAISVGVSNLILGELRLSGTAKDSQIAFYAADSGTECALYWDLKLGTFSSPGSSNPCRDTVRNNDSLVMTLSNGACANVTLTTETINGIDRSKITSRGYNTACDSDNPRKTERGLEVNY